MWKVLKELKTYNTMNYFELKMNKNVLHPNYVMLGYKFCSLFS